MDNRLVRAAMKMLMLVMGVVLLSSASASERDIAAAEVFVYKQNVANAVRYTYVVKNNGSAPITQLMIGYDYYTGAPELSGADPARTGSPRDWSARVVTMEESDFYNLTWEAETAEQSIKPGQMKAGFVVDSAIDRPDFVNSHWTVILDGSITAASSRIEQIEGPAPNIDTLPPLLTVSATPANLWPPNKRMFGITVNISVSDDTDPNPTVKLTSISCTECAQGDISGVDIGTDDRAFLLRASRLGKSKAGRVYTITYQAEDSSGNIATATTNVTVPHDQR